LLQGSSGACVQLLPYRRWLTTLLLLATALAVTSCGGGEDETERGRISVAGLPKLDALEETRSDQLARELGADKCGEA
jgi:hypothetical protein